MAVAEAKSNDNVLGYKLEKRIGAGGFGEVWRAEAPGGLSKAVKIVFGYHDEDRAKSELKALDTVKKLRHPFLLSLERIEVFEGQLVVVTELADKSLKDRFGECRNKGDAGISRSELLGYLRDAADGLDYLCNKHLLQHLDVKPENLLIVGEHIKVADYGLVKDVRNNQSIMSGMTPTYAAPELFDGRPSQLSDQYSLAIVYQEMLTGIRPFSGNTAAELARQHLKELPNLEPLPRGDQSVVAKALSKDPNHRYASCVEFIDELVRRRTSAKPIKRGHHEGEVPSVEATQVLSTSELPRTRSAENPERLPPVECDGTQAAFHPTLLIGVGRTGALALQNMKERLFERFGRSDHLAALHMLCLDTDIRDLYSITGSDERARFKDEEVLAIALSDSDAYRKTGDRYSRWLSRRWIYNVPRSLSTEGIRPLGRLAFADHIDTILERLHQLIQKLADASSLQSSAESVNLKPNATPRIYILGSISGGVGSGMIADLAYAVRMVLLEHGLSDECLNGILFHSSGKSSVGGGLATSNSYTCLKELAHYAKLGYPGDETIGLPAFDGVHSAAFSDIYLLHCGHEDFETRTRSVADYLYLDVATGCNEFFQRCRTSRDADGRLFLRTLGVSRIDLQQERTRCRFAAFLQRRLFAKWTAAPESPMDAAIEDRVGQLLQNAGITVDSLVEVGADVAAKVYGEGFANQLLEIARHAVDDENAALSVNKDITEFLGTAHQSDHPSDQPLNPAVRTLSDILTHPVQQFASQLWPKVAELIDEPALRLAGAQSVHDKCLTALDKISDELGEHVTALRDALELATTGDQETDPKTVAKIRSQEVTLVCTLQLVSRIQQANRELVHEFHDVRELLDTAASIAHSETEANTPPRPSGPDYGAVVSGFLNQHVSLFVNQLETYIVKSYMHSLGGLRRVAADGAQNASQLADAVQAESRRLVAGSFQGLNYDSVMDSVVGGEASQMEIVRDQIRLALPQLSDCGGSLRLMLAVPPATNGHVLAKCATQLFEQPPTVLRHTDGDVAVCFEGQNVLAANVGLRLLDERPDACELILRIASRSDVEWIPLTGLG